MTTVIRTADEKYAFTHAPRGPYLINMPGGTRMATCWNRRNAELIVAALNAAAEEKICYFPCAQHMGMSWTGKVGYQPPTPIRSVCPGCEPPK